MLPLLLDGVAFFSRNFIAMKARMTTSQYKLYEITDPYVAEFCQPNSALKIPHPPPPFSFGLQHYTESVVLGRHWFQLTHIDMPNTLTDIIRSRT